jgi:hypothetical protein
MGFIWGLLIVLWACFWIVCVWDIVRRHLGAGRTAAWLLIVILLPFAGALLYWILRPTPPEEVQRRMDLETDIRAGHKAPRIKP